MKVTKIALVTALMALAGNAVIAQTTDEKFPNNQLTLDVFGVYHQAFSTFGAQFDKNWNHGVWGGGLGINYYFNKYIGVGVDTYADTAHSTRVDNDASANLYLRLPIGETGLAPYIFGGLGGVFNPVTELTEDAGIGLAYRLNSHWGLFADSRYIYDHTHNSNLTRAGLSYGF
jgi:hypothetical protein